MGIISKRFVAVPVLAVMAMFAMLLVNPSNGARALAPQPNLVVAVKSSPFVRPANSNFTLTARIRADYGKVEDATMVVQLPPQVTALSVSTTGGMNCVIDNDAHTVTCTDSFIAQGFSSQATINAFQGAYADGMPRSTVSGTGTVSNVDWAPFADTAYAVETQTLA